MSKNNLVESYGRYQVSLTRYGKPLELDIAAGHNEGCCAPLSRRAQDASSHYDKKDWRTPPPRLCRKVKRRDRPVKRGPDPISTQSATSATWGTLPIARAVSTNKRNY